MTKFIDTSYIAALINPRDQLHSLAKSLASQHRGGRLLTTDSILLEIGNTSRTASSGKPLK